MPGFTASRTHSCISATTRPARRILANSSGVRFMSSVAAISAVVDGPDQPGRHIVGAAHAVHLYQLVALEVPGDQRRRLLLVQLEAPADRLLGVVLALHDLAA